MYKVKQRRRIEEKDTKTFGCSENIVDKLIFESIMHKVPGKSD